jgi:putative transposase
MPRGARIVIPDIAHHITQRGNYQQDVFDKEEDNRRYCEWMNEYAQEHGLDIAKKKGTVLINQSKKGTVLIN